MIILDVFYVAIATILVMALLQLITFASIRIMYPQEKIVYRDVPVAMQAPPQAPLFPPPPPVTNTPPVFTEPKEEIQLPEYEPRIVPSSNSVRMDTGIPDGIQETRPAGL